MCAWIRLQRAQSNRMETRAMLGEQIPEEVLKEQQSEGENR